MPCQFTQARPCTEPAAFKITIRSKHGLETVEQHCRHHVVAREQQILRDGGKIVGATQLEQRQAVEVTPTPVGLDALVVP